MTTDHYVTLGVPRTADPDAIKSAYRRAVLAHHPDHGGDAATFAAVHEAYEVLSDPVKRERYDRHGTASPAVVRSKHHVYTIGNLVAHGDLSDVYAATDEAGAPVVMKVLTDPANADLFANEVKRLAALGSSAQYMRYLPTLSETLVTRDSSRVRRSVHVLDRLDGWHTLEAIRHKQPRLRWEHGVWMFNRILEALGFVHRQGVVHGALVPSNLMAYASTEDGDSEWDHGVKLIDWCYAVDMARPITAIVPTFRGFYPPEVFDRRAAGCSTDIYMAAKCIVHVLGGQPETMTTPPHVPAFLSNFLRGCTLGNPAARPSDAWDLRREFADVVRKHDGPPRYVRFTLPAN